MSEQTRVNAAIHRSHESIVTNYRLGLGSPVKTPLHFRIYDRQGRRVVRIYLGNSAKRTWGRVGRELSAQRQRLMGDPLATLPSLGVSDMLDPYHMLAQPELRMVR